MNTKSIAFSHSSLKAYETCARQYHEVRVLKKYPREETEQTLYGTQLHEAAELYVKEGKPLEQRFTFLKPTLEALLEKPGRKMPEYEMALTETLQPCEWKAPEAWVRGIADLLIVDDDNLTAKVVDYKSGSDRYPDQDQLVLMALMVFAHFPHVRRVDGALLFVLKNRMVTNRVTRDEAETHWWKYRERVARIAASHANNVWNPKQSGLCKKWCPCLGCEFNGLR